MTTIAFRDGVMAADSGCWIGDASHGWAEKLAKGPDGVLYGVAGNAAECCGFLAWVRGGYVGPQPTPSKMGERDSSFIVLRAQHGRPTALMTAFGDEVYDGAPYLAIGAAAATAFGALFAGASAAQAIDAAKEHGSGAFGQVRTISFEV